MSVQNEVRWVLNTLVAEWPGGTPPDTLALRDRDEPVTWYPTPTWGQGYETVVEQGVELGAWAAIGVASGGRTHSFYGVDPQYDVETVVDVRVEGVHASEHGTIESDTEFNLLVDDAQAALNRVATYPEVDPDADDLGRVIYTTAQLQDETRLSSGHKDHYRTDFSVVLSGYEQTP